MRSLILFVILRGGVIWFGRGGGRRGVGGMEDEEKGGRRGTGGMGELGRETKRE